MLLQWERDALKVLYIVSPTTHRSFCTIQIHSMIKTYHCVFRMALRQQFIGFGDAIAPVKRENSFGQSSQRHIGYRFCAEIVLFCLLLSLCVYFLCSCREKSFNMRVFFNGAYGYKGMQQKSHLVLQSCLQSAGQKVMAGSLGVMAAKHLRSAVINMDITN